MAFALGSLILFQDSFQAGFFGLTQFMDLALLGCAGFGSDVATFMIQVKSKDQNYLKEHFDIKEVAPPKIEVNEL